MTIGAIFSGTVWEIVSESSAFGMFILAVLVFMSFMSWVIIFNKWRLFRQAEADTSRFSSHFKRSRNLAESVGQARSLNNSPLSQVFIAGKEELADLYEQRNQGGGLQETTRPLTNSDFDVIEMTMERTMIEELHKLEKQVVFLATTANAAPFMGLLGTVVGIMDSFWSIGERGSASLAVVAPGIAEALLATIVGLGTAIPAVIAFNWANNKMKLMHDHSANFVLSFIARARKEAL
ncbi:MAG: MotA/TolQ/ExbB proton channel family protein [Candidatus Zixiibacteriota bacterium]